MPRASRLEYSDVQAVIDSGTQEVDWVSQELDGVDLLTLAAEFDQAAKGTFSPALRQGLADASAKFAKTGLSRMQ